MNIHSMMHLELHDARLRDLRVQADHARLVAAAGTPRSNTHGRTSGSHRRGLGHRWRALTHL